MIENKKLDYQIGKITSIREHKDGYEICQDGVFFWLDKKYGIKPVVGQTVETYGGMGRSIQGICIDGKTAFFKGELQMEREHKEWSKNYDRKKQTEFEKNKQQLDEDYNSLPLVFQKRLDILRKNNPNFRWEYEHYEMFCCKEAIKIATVFKKPEELKAFSEADYKEQRKMLPILSRDHSGNTFGFACRLAYWYITEPDNVWKEHGALCPLVGCEDYGCWVLTLESKKKGLIK